jgi:predicted NAD/FAD-dependent oxidoreductase
MDSTDTLIIGAGISGLLCATELRKAGKSVRLLDKGRGLGGRMSTRRMAGGRLDHGAQYFTVKDARFQAYVDEWLEAGVVKEWFSHLPEDSNPEGYPRYCGVRGMTDAPKWLGRELQVENSQQVIALTRDTDQWVARTQSGDCFGGQHLVLTAPLPQALSLLDSSGLRYANGSTEALRAIRYERGLATMAILDGPSGLPSPGGLKITEAPLSWIGDNQQKGISPEVPAVTIHSDAAFADAHWDAPDEVRGTLMLKAAAPYLQAGVKEFTCHRWGFTKALEPWPERCFHNVGLSLTLAGDSFGGPRVEGAALSGLAAADRILAEAPNAVSSAGG